MINSTVPACSEIIGISNLVIIKSKKILLIFFLNKNKRYKRI